MSSADKEAPADAEERMPDSAPAGVETVAVEATAPLARLRGEPVLEMPHDLYIPPDALRIFLETFEGPLDLLLYLIRRQNFEVLDIPMAEMTRQYMDYIALMRANQLELAAEYLLMAALLIEIKSRMLLPKPSENVDSEADPRAELVRRLLEYEQMKQAALSLDALPCAGRDYLLVLVEIEHSTAQRLPSVTAIDVRDAWSSAMTRAQQNRHHKVSRETLSVREQMTRILRRLRHGEFVDFVDLYRSEKGAAEIVVCFLAVLELAREALIEVTQHESFSTIYLKLFEAQTADGGKQSNAA